MINKYLAVFIFTVLLTSCGQQSGDLHASGDSTGKSLSAEKEMMTVPGADRLNFTDTVQLKAGDEMKFDKNLFRVKVGKNLVLRLTNTAKKSSTAMAHNVVILAKGTDIADFAEAVHTGKSEQYVPASVETLVIAHTHLVSGGDTEQVPFIIPSPGVYDFICSFPGHWGTMQGKIVAE
jgi:azurin